MKHLIGRLVLWLIGADIVIKKYFNKYDRLPTVDELREFEAQSGGGSE